MIVQKNPKIPKSNCDNLIKWTQNMDVLLSSTHDAQDRINIMKYIFDNIIYCCRHSSSQDAYKIRHNKLFINVTYEKLLDIDREMFQDYRHLYNRMWKKWFINARVRLQRLLLLQTLPEKVLTVKVLKDLPKVLEKEILGYIE